MIKVVSEGIDRQSKDNSRKAVEGSYAVKRNKINYAKKESVQIAKEMGSSIINRAVGKSSFFMGEDIRSNKVEMSCSICEKDGTELFIINGQKICRDCKKEKKI